MWCKSCRQDVPGIASLEEGVLNCARCGGRIARKRMLAETSVAQDPCDSGIDLSGTVEAEPDPTALLRSWDQDEDLERARRLLRPACKATSTETQQQQFRLRFDPPASQDLRVSLPQPAYFPSEEVPTPSRASYPQNMAFSGPVGLLSGLGWGLVSLGLMGMACGAVLSGWGWMTARAELWSAGLPVLLVSQGGVLLGLLFALLTRRSGEETSASLPAMSAGTGGYSFPHQVAQPAYQGADPSAAAPKLIADLRSQLDFLAAQMAATTAAGQQQYR